MTHEWTRGDRFTSRQQTLKNRAHGQLFLHSGRSRRPDPVFKNCLFLVAYVSLLSEPVQPRYIRFFSMSFASPLLMIRPSLRSSDMVSRVVVLLVIQGQTPDEIYFKFCHSLCLQVGQLQTLYLPSIHFFWLGRSISQRS